MERLEARNDAAYRYVYVLVGASLPLQTCRSRLEVRPDGEECRVARSSDSDVLGDAERVAEAAIRSTYRAGLGALATALGSL